VILEKGRFILVAGCVAFAAFLFGFGTLLTGAQPSQRPRSQGRAATVRHSGDDGGFSVTLTEPSEPYLVGIRRIVIEAAVPPGDSVVGVDFFVDGRLSATDRRPPYATEIDFGQEIHRHTIIVTANTAGGRHAKVSFVSRAADLEGGTTSPLTLVPAVVRDAGGKFIDGLSVGDFVLMENGERRPIIHFDDDPVPQSVAVAIQAGVPDETHSAFRRGALMFTDSLRTFDSLGLIPVGGLVPESTAPKATLPRTEKKVEPPALPVVGFSYDHGQFAEELAGLEEGEDRPPHRPFMEALLIATHSLQTRPRGRVILALLAGQGPREIPTEIAHAGFGPPQPVAIPAEDETEQVAADELIAALDDVRKSGATLHVVVYGGAEEFPFPQIKKVAEETGGEFLVAASSEGVAASCRRVAESLQHQYLVSFAPGTVSVEGWRTIELRLRAPELSVQARKTYFASPPLKKP
jgi:hypothetical protein